MKYQGGWFGKLLRINLTTKTSAVEDIPEKLLKDYLGGAALGSKILYDELAPGIDPLGEENKLLYTTGPLTGTDAPCASRLNIATKSPLTGTVTNSLSGGHFPVELKWTGYDVVVIEGKSAEPVYIVIKDGGVSFKSAQKLWGLNTFDTQSIIKENLKDLNVRISCIGPAGENQSLMAAIINEARAAGRKGVGAVMGSKNLKAVVVRGSQQVPIADKQRFKAGVSGVLRGLKASPMAYPIFSKVGSVSAAEPVAAVGCLPSNNWQNDKEIDWVEKIGDKGLAPSDQTINPCYRCPVSCSQVRMAKKGKYAGISTEGPEFETIYSLGSCVGVTDPEAVIVADRLCDELGLDTISAGVAVGMAMELVERGILADEDGIGLRFGNDDAVMRMLRDLAYRQGQMGRLFCNGTKRASEALGEHTAYYAMQVKGLELPAYDVRGFKAHGLNYATCYTGADHNKGYSIQEVFGTPVPYPVERLDLKGKGVLTKINQDFAGLFDTITLCEFAAIFIPDAFQRLMAEMLSGATGLEFTEQDMWDVGERLNNLCRMFNVREGFSRKDDTLPPRLMTEPLKFGLSKGEKISQEDLDFMLDEYYEARQWDSNGIPTAEKLTALGLQDTIKDLPAKA